MEGENGAIPETKPSSASGSRWNPTKEQITMLEGLYKEGIRTPTAEQIQHITGKLKRYGRIEGKNVFYWFQNHKARQRQKQKQESPTCFARFVRTRAREPVLYPAPPPPTLLPTIPACAAADGVPFCMPGYAGAVGFYPPYHHQRMVFTGAVNSRLPAGTAFQTADQAVWWTPDEEPVDSHDQPYENDSGGSPSEQGGAHQETLQLFPLHPTGVLQDKSRSSGARCSVSDDSRSMEEGESCGETHLPPFDFLNRY